MGYISIYHIVDYLMYIYIYINNNLIILIIIIRLQLFLLVLLLLLLLLLLSGEWSQFTNLKYSQQKLDNSRILSTILVSQTEKISGPDPHCQQEWLEFASEIPWRIDMEIPDGNPKEATVGALGQGPRGVQFLFTPKQRVLIFIPPKYEKYWKIIGNVI